MDPCGGPSSSAEVLSLQVWQVRNQSSRDRGQERIETWKARGKAAVFTKHKAAAFKQTFTGLKARDAS